MRRFSQWRLAVTIGIAVLLEGCATPMTVFKPYEPRDNAFEGKGGTTIVIDGMDFWENGEPPRKFSVLGIIDDERAGSRRALRSLHADIVKLARESKGDAVVVLGSSSTISGYYSMPAGSTTATVPLRRRSSTYAVIKYVD